MFAAAMMIGVALTLSAVALAAVAFRHQLLRAVADKGKLFRKLGESFDGDVGIGFWSKDGSTIYFNEGIKATDQSRLEEIGSLVAAFPVEAEDQLMLVSDGGTLIRIPVEGIRIASRASKGVGMM